MGEKKNLIQSKVPLFSILWKLRETKKLQKKNLKLTEVDSWGLRKGAVFITKLQGEEASANIGVVACYLS